MRIAWIGCVLLGCGANPGSFDHYQFGRDSGSHVVGEGGATGAEGKADKEKQDAATISNESDSNVSFSLEGEWAIARSSPPIDCASSQLPAQGDYGDVWAITVNGSVASVSVVTSDWPVTDYLGTWDGVTLELSGQGDGPVDGFHSTVSTSFRLTVIGGSLAGSETSEANQCEQDRTVKGVRE